MLKEFRTDYNQTHFVRNETFKQAADNINGPARKIFIEFLERSCTAEFSGFLLYKELGRRLKKANPAGSAVPNLHFAPALACQLMHSLQLRLVHIVQGVVLQHCHVVASKGLCGLQWQRSSRSCPEMRHDTRAF